LKLVADFGSIDRMPSEIQEAVGPSVQEIRNIFLKPDVTNEYEIRLTLPISMESSDFSATNESSLWSVLKLLWSGRLEGSEPLTRNDSF
jgi:hypothetical protein